MGDVTWTTEEAVNPPDLVPLDVLAPRKLNTVFATGVITTIAWSGVSEYSCNKALLIRYFPDGTVLS